MRLESRASWATSVRPLLTLLALVAPAVSCGDSTAPPAHGPPTSMVKIAGDESTGNAGAAVTPAPAVRITDAEGRPVPEVEVTFVVVTGSGTVAGALVETDEDGIATVGGWTLGTLGANTMRASVSAALDLTAVTFSSTSLCPASVPLALGGEVSGALAATDCRYDEGYLTDRYTFTLATGGAILFTQTSSAIDSYIELITDGRQVVAFHDDIVQGTNLTAALRVLLPPGTYQVGASSAQPDEVGGYNLRAESANTALTGCDILFVLPGVGADQDLEATDCPTQPDVYFEEWYIVWMRGGRPHTISMSSDAFDTILFLLNSSGGAVSTNDDADPGSTNSRIVFTPVNSGFYLIVASSVDQQQSGTYRLTVE